MTIDKWYLNISFLQNYGFSVTRFN